MESTCSNGLQTSTASTEDALSHHFLKPQIALGDTEFPKMIGTQSELTKVPYAPTKELIGVWPRMVGRGRQRVKVGFLLLNGRETIDG